MPEAISARTLPSDLDAPQRRGVGLVQWALPVTITILLLLAGAMLYLRFQRYSIGVIMSSAASLRTSQLVVAGVLTLASYIVLIAYDRLAIAYVSAQVPYRKIVAASLTSYAFCNTIGLSLLTGSMIRWSFYRGSEIRTEQIPIIVGFCVATSWLGLLCLSGIVLAFQALLLSRGLAVSAHALQITGVGLLAICFAYVFLGRSQMSVLRIWSLRLPTASFHLATMQIATATVNWMLVAGVVAAVLPLETRLSYFEVLSIFTISQSAGLLSQIPGGLGVFEATFVLIMSRLVPTEILPLVAGSLLAYRALYCLLPFTVMTLVHAVWFVKTRVTA